MTGWWVTSVLETGGPVLLISWVLWVITSIVLHELAHGWMAIRCGDDTPIRLGHMTWNPVVHMGVPSLVMFAVVGIAWGAMPVSPSRFRKSTDDAVVAFAGPAMNLLLALVCVLLGGLWVAAAGGYWGFKPPVSDTMFKNFQTFFRVGAGLNIVLTIFNLLPVPPLDGSRIAMRFVPGYRGLVESFGQAGSMILFILLFMFAGSVIFGIGFGIATEALDGMTKVLTGGRAGP